MNEQRAEYLENLFQKFCNSYEDCPKDSDCTECRNKFIKSIQIGIDESRKENAELKKELESYKAFDSHYNEIEEDAKRIAKENAGLKAMIEKMKCCGNCKHWIEGFDNNDEPIFYCEKQQCKHHEKWELAE